MPESCGVGGVSAPVKTRGVETAPDSPPAVSGVQTTVACSPADAADERVVVERHADFASLARRYALVGVLLQEVRDRLVVLPDVLVELPIDVDGPVGADGTNG